jgi:hypothetical protein
VSKPLTVQFTYKAERDPLFWAPPVPVELRAEVSFALDGEPTVEPLERARWVDELGPETVGTTLAADRKTVVAIESPAWIGAKEAATDAACELLSQQATRETAALPEAS